MLIEIDGLGSATVSPQKNVAEIDAGAAVVGTDLHGLGEIILRAREIALQPFSSPSMT